MKSIRILFPLIILLVVTLSFPLGAQEEAVENPDQKKEKFTTPPLQLTEEEENKTPENTTSTPVSKWQKVTKADEIAFSPTPVKSNTALELIVDASGSMNGLMGQSTKMALVKSAINDVLSQPLPEGADREIGLRIYGSQSPSEENVCTDTSYISEISPFDKIKFREQIDSITALGVTPIGYTLEKAAEDFQTKTDTDNVIVLITDGADSCGADVCEIAKTIHTGPKKIIIHVIGYDLDQSAISALSCVAKNAGGQLVLARSEPELRTALDQVLMANVPYNLRIQALNGAAPLPTRMTVYKSGTKNIIREDETAGVKYYQLQVGAYDIEITYDQSKETPQPSKLLKGVEVQSTSKAEQTVQFDLGALTLSALDQNGSHVAAEYVLNKRENVKIGAKFTTPPGPHTLFLTKGTYTANVTAKTPEGMMLHSTAQGLKVNPGETTVHDFQFQVGKIQIAGRDAQGDPIALKYKVTIAGDEAKKVLEGIAKAEGKTIEVTPGKYDLYFHAAIEDIGELPSIKKEAVEVSGGDTLEALIEIPTAQLTLSAKDGNGKFAETTFKVKPAGSDQEPAKFEFKEEPVTITLPPGDYDVLAEFVTTESSPPPTINWENVHLHDNEKLIKEAIFKFGTLNLYGKNSKGAPINTAFYIYQVGGNESVATLTNITYKTDLKMPEGFYDIKAEQLSAINDPKPNVWFHNVEVKANSPVTKEAIFTHGRIKLMCRGPNDIVLECDYHLFAYGKDSPLFEGTTTENWKMFDIPPGSYYIEAGYHDAVDEVLLKKWITISVKDNEWLEEIIRF